MTFKIRDKENGLFSHGVIQRSWRFDSASGKYEYYVKFSSGGKEWKSETLVKKHLLSCAQKGIKWAEWEIVEVVHAPTKPIDDWFDSKMLYKAIKAC